MRVFFLAAAFSLASLGTAQHSKPPTITLRNESNRPIEISVGIREGKSLKPVGKPILLPVKSGSRVFPGLFGPKRGDAHYTITISDSKHRRLGLVRLNSQMVRSGEKNGMRFSVNNQAVNVTVGSRRQRFLLLP
jgi:hypothetical protein